MITAKDTWNYVKPYIYNERLNPRFHFYLITAKFIAPIVEIRLHNGELLVRLRSASIYYDMDHKFEDTIQIFESIARIGDRRSSDTDFEPPDKRLGATEIAKDLSYHDVEVYCGNTRYRVADNYAYHLRCCKCAGWELWFIWQGTEKLLGGEYEDAPFCITAAGTPIVGTIPLEIEEP